MLYMHVIFLSDLGFGGVRDFFNPFPKVSLLGLLQGVVPVCCKLLLRVHSSTAIIHNTVYIQAKLGKSRDRV